MLLSKIHSKYLIPHLFSFIKENKMLKIIKGNSFLNKNLNKNLNLSNKEYKIFFFKRKIENYNFYYINDYFQKFKNDFNSVIKNEEEIKELVSNCLSQNDNFELKLSDTNFNIILDNPYFKEKIRINFECLNEKNSFRILLIKNNILTKKAERVFKDIFKLYSNNEKMSKLKYSKLLSLILKNNVNENEEKVNKVFLKYNIDKSGLLSFQEFINLYLDLIKEDMDSVWKDLYSLGYNNLLEKEINFDLNNLEALEFEQTLDNNFLDLLKKSKDNNIFKLSLLMIIDIKYLKLLNKVFESIKRLDISISNLNKIIELKIKCYNIEELSLNIFEEDLKCNIKELSSIFPSLTNLNIYIERKFDLFQLMKNLNNFNINTLKIVISNIDDDFNYFRKNYKFRNRY